MQHFPLTTRFNLILLKDGGGYQHEWNQQPFSCGLHYRFHAEETWCWNWPFHREGRVFWGRGKVQSLPLTKSFPIGESLLLMLCVAGNGSHGEKWRIDRILICVADSPVPLHLDLFCYQMCLIVNRVLGAECLAFPEMCLNWENLVEGATLTMEMRRSSVS